MRRGGQVGLVTAVHKDVKRRISVKRAIGHWHLSGRRNGHTRRSFSDGETVGCVFLGDGLCHGVSLPLRQSEAGKHSRPRSAGHCRVRSCLAAFAAPLSRLAAAPNAAICKRPARPAQPRSKSKATAPPAYRQGAGKTAGPKSVISMVAEEDLNPLKIPRSNQLRYPIGAAKGLKSGSGSKRSPS